VKIDKTMCESIGEQNVCNGRDTSLSGYSIDFEIYAGDLREVDGELVEVVTVVLGENENGEGNLGGGSQGFKLSSELEPGTYTVCEIPVAYTDTDEVDLEGFPRPEPGNGGSSGGQQEQIEGTDCIVVELTSGGRAVVQFLDLVETDVTPTPTPTPTTATPTPTPAGAQLGGTSTPTPAALGGVAGGVPTARPGVPNTALPGGTVDHLPATVLGLVVLVSFGGLVQLRIAEGNRRRR
jgi:hypothetical protein